MGSRGYDTLRGLGHGATGGLAAPNSRTSCAALDGTPNVDASSGWHEAVAINRKTGHAANEGEAGTIISLAGTGPADSWVTAWAPMVPMPGGALSPQANQAIQSGGGGLY